MEKTKLFADRRCSHDPPTSSLALGSALGTLCCGASKAANYGDDLNRFDNRRGGDDGW
jgi:hypothetical protein